jgi:putative ABC transport system substrate-binding protein
VLVHGPDEELDAAFAAMARSQSDAVVIQGSLSTKRLADLTIEHRLPAASTTRAFVDAGGLMAYGADGPTLFRHSAKFIHRIVQGGQPSDLPIEQPTKFELAINLRTAKASRKQKVSRSKKHFCFVLIHCSNKGAVWL